MHFAVSMLLCSPRLAKHAVVKAPRARWHDVWVHIPTAQIPPAALKVPGMEALQEQPLSIRSPMQRSNAPLHLLLCISHALGRQVLQLKGLLS